LRDAFPYDSAPKYLIFDRGANFNDEVVDTIESFPIRPKRTSPQSPGRMELPSDSSATAAAIFLTT
jgi:hypothetical protein